MLSLLASPLASHALHLLVLVATGSLLASLASALCDAKAAPWLAVLAAAPAVAVAGGVSTLDPLLLPRGLALPFELLALRLALERRWTVAGCWMALAVAVHAPSGVAGAAGLAGLGMRDKGSVGWLLPLIPMAVLGLGVELGEPLVGHWDLLQARLSHHLLPWTFPLRHLALGVVLALLATRDSRVRPAVLGLVGWALLAGLLGPLLRIRVLLNLEPWQALRLVALLALVVGAAGLARRPVAWAPLLAALWWFAPRATFSPWGAPDDLGELARRVAVDAPPDAVFLLPPTTPPGFRPLARRASVGTWKDGGEAQFSAETAARWERVMRTIEPAWLDGPGAPRTKLSAAWSARTPDERRALASALGADHLVDRSPFPGARRVGDLWWGPVIP